jgi:uncharacterized membrane protein YdfJ with MMPL/SSD domain
MADSSKETPRPARPLVGYQDTGAEETRWSRRSVVRAWIILAVIALVYLGWTLTVYFLEPGLR